MHQQVLHIQRHYSWSTKRIIKLCIPHRPFTFFPATFRRPSIKNFTCLGKLQPDLHWPALRPRFLCILHRQLCQFNRPYQHINGHTQYRQQTLLHGPQKRRAITCRTHTSALPILKQRPHTLNQVRHCPIHPSISLQPCRVDLDRLHHLWLLRHMSRVNLRACPQTLAQKPCHHKRSPTPRPEKLKIHQNHFSRHSHLQSAYYDNPSPSFART